MVGRSGQRIASRMLGAGIALSLLVPGLASAQAIGGAVTDATGGVLPGTGIRNRTRNAVPGTTWRESQ